MVNRYSKTIMGMLVILGSCSSNDNRIAQVKTKTNSVQELPNEDHTFPCCRDSVLLAIGERDFFKNFKRTTSHSYSLNNVELTIGEDYIKISHKHYDGIVEFDIVSAWLNAVNRDSIKVYGKLDKESYFIVSSKVKKATGLAVNFTKWLVLKPSSKTAFDFWSLDDDPKFFYHKPEEPDKLNAVIFNYSDEFIHNKDWNKLSLKVSNYQIGSGTKRVVRETHCQCD